MHLPSQGLRDVALNGQTHRHCLYWKDAGCSMLVGAKRKSRFIGNTGYKNDLNPYFIPAKRDLRPRRTSPLRSSQHPDARIQYLFVCRLKIIFTNLTHLLSFWPNKTFNAHNAYRRE
jgi:hypothetical protein